ncbi:MAG: FadR/GntR family transcriptional regulator [Devosia sp.]|uniref:FadR/GntR family transcriptional regulator n=1 Tax=Devosia sp. XGJD_8 TaxID=3391187 RepID=UPI001D843ABA|nr:FadR family transcriptional regulator [Alphaproteobacteria bacterium]MBU1560598.1 FadR family transcriptional regulator [Alphaproteobacteria bacterium]MBU2302018.1 FadR family transcriptional regulator [Alphaproteobacteria bacterium]MBU2367377.1 FadR family transcriptional regulator [Alphaproteobacteria bacterium]
MTTAEGDQRTDQPTAAMTIADALAREILSEMSPGVSLPSEAELAARYDVSRLTIREAVKLLEGRGLLAIARGRKAVVREPDGAAFADFLTSVIRYDSKGLFDLVEVRLALEVQSATLAAKRATRAGIAAIESELQGMRDTVGIPGEPMTHEQEVGFHTHDVGFHEAVALASGNRVLGFLFEAMARPLREGFFISRRGHEQRGHSLHDTIEAHQRILDCIKAGNGRTAAEAMRVHLKDTERDIRVAMRQLARQGPGT